MRIIGIDEVGRGCWAGPLVASAIILDTPVDGIRDSKTLSAKKREKYNHVIRSSSPQIGIGWVFPSEIDRIGMSACVKLAMVRALKDMPRLQSEHNGTLIIIDGNINYFSDENLESLLGHDGGIETVAIVKADSAYPSVSAASIIAKVARDAYMRRQSTLYPCYGFDTHVGYGTKEHVEALHVYGVTSLHRQSFRPIRELMGN